MTSVTSGQGWLQQQSYPLSANHTVEFCGCMLLNLSTTKSTNSGIMACCCSLTRCVFDTTSNVATTLTCQYGGEVPVSSNCVWLLSAALAVTGTCPSSQALAFAGCMPNPL